MDMRSGCPSKSPITARESMFARSSRPYAQVTMLCLNLRRVREKLSRSCVQLWHLWRSKGRGKRLFSLKKVTKWNKTQLLTQSSTAHAPTHRLSKWLMRSRQSCLTGAQHNHLPPSSNSASWRTLRVTYSLICWIINAVNCDSRED